MSTSTLAIQDTTIGKKFVMALSGVVLFGFVIGHMLGNLQILLGDNGQAINEYSNTLHETPGLLWGTRIVLLLAVTAHIVSALQLTMRNRSARPVKYKIKKDVVTSYAAKAMPLTGMVVLSYIVYHLLHLTIGVTAGLGYQHLPLDANGLPDVYHNIVHSFQVPWCTAVYLFAQLCLGLHLYHGSWSLLQSLGLSHRRYNDTVRSAAIGIALVVVAGFSVVPVAVFLGYVR